MEFKKYPSIENTEKDYIIQKIRNHGFEYKKYCITEKIHGSNTQIAYYPETNEFSYGKRTCFIEEGEHCYNVQEHFERLKNDIVKLYHYLRDSLNEELTSVIVYGEIFGGAYPHPDVPRDNKATKVQKGVYYTPANSWMAFDISYTVKDKSETYFLSAKDFILACDAICIPTVPVLKIVDTLTEALEYPNDGTSVVYKFFYNLPEIEENIMEGVVIRPFEKDLWMGQTRVILKNKNEKFKEKSHEPKPDLTLNYSDNLKTALSEVETYVTENRINNVISHEGEVSESDIGRLIGLTAKDVVDEFGKDSKVWNLLEKVEQKIITKHIAHLASSLVRAAVYERLAEKEGIICS